METPVVVGDPLAGHLVQGDVDAVGKVVRIEKEGMARRVWIKMPDRLAPLGRRQGADRGRRCQPDCGGGGARSVLRRLDPLTLGNTTLGELAVGDRVNLESDLVTRISRRWPDRAGSMLADVVAALPWSGHVSGSPGVQKVVA